MADVTDAVFRQLIAKYSKPAGPDVFFTEFVSADGLVHPEAQAKLKRELFYTKIEQPIVAQLFSSNPTKMKQAASLVAGWGLAGIDINMGCPDKTVEKQKAGSALIKNPTLAQEIIIAAKEGVLEAGYSIPISVKTRLGYNQLELPAWPEALIAACPAAVTFHLRTRKEMSKVPARWEEAQILADIFSGTDILLLGNGDVKTPAEAKTKAQTYGLDGIMIGRGIYGRPWLFTGPDPDLKTRLSILIEHLELFDRYYGQSEFNQQQFQGHQKNYAVMKKHFKAYVTDFTKAVELRNLLMETTEATAAIDLLKRFIKNNLL